VRSSFSARPSLCTLRDRLLGGVVGCGLALMGACSGQVTGPSQTSTSTPDEAAVAVVCGAVDDAALAVFDGATCPWVLLSRDGELRLESSAPGVAGLSVEAPRPCVEAPGRCRWEGAATSLGPALLAIVEGPESEHPVDVWFGAGLDGERVLFAELWWGERSVIDRTEVGPIYTLTPLDCGALVFTVDGRLPEAKMGAPDPALLERAGVYAFEVGALVRSGALPETPTCKPIFAALP